LYGVFTIIYLIQNIFLEYTILQLNCCCSMYHIWCYFPRKTFCICISVLFQVHAQCLVPSMVVSCSSLSHHTVDTVSICYRFLFSIFFFCMVFGLCCYYFTFRSPLDTHANKPSSLTSCLPLDTACTSQRTHPVSVTKVNVKFTLVQATKTEGKERYSSTLSLTLVLDWGWVVNVTPWLLYPPAYLTENGLIQALITPWWPQCDFTGNHGSEMWLYQVIRPQYYIGQAAVIILQLLSCSFCFF